MIGSDILEFTPLTLNEIDLLRPYFQANDNRLCDCTVGGTFIWRDYFETAYAIAGGALYLKVRYLPDTTAFTSPLGVPLTRDAFEPILGYCRRHGMPPLLCAVSDSRRREIQGLFPCSRASTDRAWSDYLYNATDIVTLAGRSYCGQRNHINRFSREYPQWSFERVGEENLAQTREFFVNYSDEHHKTYPTYEEGNRKTLEVIDNLGAYRLSGGVLKVGGAVAGASFGETVGDTLYIHIEKSDTSFLGSYPVLVNQFARMFAPSGDGYINREEDDGVEGLRASKLSYHPAAVLDKYVIELK